MRRAILMVATMALTVLVASGVALAVNKIGTDGPDALRGTNGDDNLIGKGGNERRPLGATRTWSGVPETMG